MIDTSERRVSMASQCRLVGISRSSFYYKAKPIKPEYLELMRLLDALDPGRVVLGIMDGLPGLQKVFTQELTDAKVHRCQIHVAQNVLAKVLGKLKKIISDEVPSIFYASSKSKDLGFLEQFKKRWSNGLPSGVKCLKHSLDVCLTYLQFPEEEWICLRTTKVIERGNNKFKRRTKPMEIVAGERCCHTLLAFVCLRVELRWRSKPIGNVGKNPPFFKELAEMNFTEKS